MLLDHMGYTRYKTLIMNYLQIFFTNKWHKGHHRITPNSGRTLFLLFLIQIGRHTIVRIMFFGWMCGCFLYSVNGTKTSLGLSTIYSFLILRAETLFLFNTRKVIDNALKNHYINSSKRSINKYKNTCKKRCCNHQ